MSRTLTIALVAVSLLLLGGAWLVSRALTSEVSLPEGYSSAPARAQVIVPVVPVNALPMAEPARPEPPQLAVEVPVKEPVPPPPAAPVEEAKLDVPMAESPFNDEDSPELEHAWRLVFGPRANPDTWRNAAEVFEKCLKEVPNNERCKQGLVAAQSKLKGVEPPYAFGQPPQRLMNVPGERVRGPHGPKHDNAE